MRVNAKIKIDMLTTGPQNNFTDLRVTKYLFLSIDYLHYNQYSHHFFQDFEYCMGSLHLRLFQHLKLVFNFSFLTISYKC